MNTNTYQNPTVPFTDEDVPETETMWTDIDPAIASNQPSRRSKHFLLAVGAFVVVAFVAFYRPSSSMKEPAAAAADVSDVTMLGASKVAPCTFSECAGAGCNAEVAPYTCLFHNGGPHGGCSAVPWTPETCTKQCDMTGCDSLEIPKSQGDCKGKCPKAWCTMGRLCGKDAPYQCTNGASAFGCSIDEYQWTFRVSDAACSSCCDSTTCE